MKKKFIGKLTDEFTPVPPLASAASTVITTRSSQINFYFYFNS